MGTGPRIPLSVAFAASLVTLGVGAGAQGVLLPERIGHPEQPFALKRVRVSAAITDGVAETTVEQTFVNHSSLEQEGTFLFPLPEGASVTSLSLRAGDRVLEGRLLGRDEARSLYESVVRRRRDPALLEYVGRGLFRSSVFPIPPHGERQLTLRYAEVLKPEGGVRKYSHPLSAGRFSCRPPSVSSVSVKLRTTPPLKAVYSPSHDVSVRRHDDHSATATWESRGEYPDRDFVLYYSTGADDVGLSLLLHETPGRQGGHFVLIAAPRWSIPRERILPKQIVFVLDRTGSMQPNGKMEQARNALHFCLDNLQPQDRFSVITFNEAADAMTRRLVPASRENIQRAHRFVSDAEPTGGTNIDEALRAALGQLRDAEGSQRMVVFLTDGLPTVGETNVEAILASVRRLNRGAEAGIKAGAAPVNARVFCFGVGYDVNVAFLDRLAEESRADADYVRPKESIEAIVSAFFSKVSSPILSDLKLNFDGAEVHDLYPKDLPDLFKGGQIVVAARFRGDPRGAVRLSGRSQDRPVTFKLSDAFGEKAARSALVPRIWAARKIGWLLDQVRLHSNREVIDEIIRLSKEYGIITPYTSYLADERQDALVRPRRAGDHVLYYEEDREVAGAQARDAVVELRRLSEKLRGEEGSAETHRSLNAKGLYQANRAPTAAQGGFGGGGLGGFGSGGASLGVPAGPGGEAERDKLSLDYFSAAGRPAHGDRDVPGYKQIGEAARVQAVAGRVFYKRRDVWFDNDAKPGQKVVRVRALSDAHFQLLRAVPALARYAAVGGEVVISLGRVAVQVGREGKERLTDSELAELTGRG